MTANVRDLAGRVLILATSARQAQDQIAIDPQLDGRALAKRSIQMTGLSTKGSINKATGKVEEGLGKLTDDPSLRAKGKAKQIKGGAQQGLGKLQDVTRPR